MKIDKNVPIPARKTTPSKAWRTLRSKLEGLHLNVGESVWLPLSVRDTDYPKEGDDEECARLMGVTMRTVLHVPEQGFTTKLEYNGRGVPGVRIWRTR